MKMTKDILKDLLENPDEVWIPRALTDRSCLNSKMNHVDSLEDTNYELATLGDSVLRLCLLDIFLDKGRELSHLKELYERDEVLVTIIGRYYSILDRIRFNESDSKWPNDYQWCPHGGSRNDKVHKHIATAMEALLGAVYRLRGIRSARAVVKNWVRIVDQSDTR